MSLVALSAYASLTPWKRFFAVSAATPKASNVLDDREGSVARRGLPAWVSSRIYAMAAGDGGACCSWRRDPALVCIGVRCRALYSRCPRARRLAGSCWRHICAADAAVPCWAWVAHISILITPDWCRLTPGSWLGYADRLMEFPPRCCWVAVGWCHAGWLPPPAGRRQPALFRHTLIQSAPVVLAVPTSAALVDLCHAAGGVPVPPRRPLT